MVQSVAPTQLTADLRRLRYADLRRSAKRSLRRSAVNSSLVIEKVRLNHYRISSIAVFDSPGRVQSVFPSLVKTDQVAIRISQIRLTPQPRLVHRIGDELESSSL